MDVLLALFYLLFTVCVVYPPPECVVGGFTIPQIFASSLGSENTNFVFHHIKRITFTTIIHSFLPMGFFVVQDIGGWRSQYVPFHIIIALCSLFAFIVSYRVFKQSVNHPGMKSIVPYVVEGTDCKAIAAEINSEFKRVDKVVVQLRSTTKIIATLHWLIKVSQYKVEYIKQADCTLVATTSDSHHMTETGDDSVQYLNIDVISSRPGVKGFSIRIAAQALGDLQQRLLREVRVPPHVSLQPTITDRFLEVFRSCVMQNPEYIVTDNQEQEQCIGCMQNLADVKLQQRCMLPPAPPGLQDLPPPCQNCQCKVLWCTSCMGRWWAARVGRIPPSRWLMARCTCPVCRAVFCVFDVCPARFPTAAPAPPPAH